MSSSGSQGIRYQNDGSSSLRISGFTTQPGIITPVKAQPQGEEETLKALDTEILEFVEDDEAALTEEIQQATTTSCKDDIYTAIRGICRNIQGEFPKVKFN